MVYIFFPDIISSIYYSLQSVTSINNIILINPICRIAYQVHYFRETAGIMC